MIDILNNIMEKDKKLCIGLMSGTSLDGIDAALVEIEGNYKDTKVRLLEFLMLPYSQVEREFILKLCSPSTSKIDDICEMNVYLGNKMGQAAVKVAQKAGMSLKEIDFISSHGQTIYHMPEKNSTFQIGELAVIAAVTEAVTVGDFRPSDMAYGGQGAPLVPYVDYLLFSHTDKSRVLLNIGGMSNITVLKADGNEDDVWAFDTGPGNVLIDAVMKIGTNGRMNYDLGGVMALSGRTCLDWLSKILAEDSYLDKKPPKSTGREYYTLDYAGKLYTYGIGMGLSFNDILATITCYTAHAVESQLRRFVEPKCKVDEVFVSGGGVHNKALMQELKRIIKAEVKSAEELDFSVDAKEAVAFAILGNEFLSGRTNNLPGATGAAKKVIMGKLALPSR